MSQDTFKVVFLVGWLATLVIRGGFTRQRRRDKNSDLRATPTDIFLLALTFVGLTILPMLYILTDTLNFANYTLPAWAGVAGAVLLGVSLWLIYRSHADLGRNWSPTMEVTTTQTLVTGGIYARVRHPMYAAFFLQALSQPLLIWNGLAGFAGLVTLLLMFAYRIPREETMMLEHFGDEYRAYMARSKRLIPGVL